MLRPAGTSTGLSLSVSADGVKQLLRADQHPNRSALAERDGLAAGAELVNAAHDPRSGSIAEKLPESGAAAARSPWTAQSLPQKVCSYLR